MTTPNDPFIIAGTTMASRLFVGSARYPNQQVMLDAMAASGPCMVTMSIRRISLEGYAESLVDLLGGRYPILPNTAGCVTARDAVLTAELAREALGTNWIKLELIGDRDLLYPDVEQLAHAADELVRKNFVVLPYCNEDPVSCQKLADVGCAAVMPLGCSLIGSGPRHRQPGGDRAHLQPQPGAGRARCRDRHRLGRGAGDGTGLRRGDGRYRDRQVARPRPHGGGNEGRGRGRAARPARRPHPEKRPSPSRRARSWDWSGLNSPAVIARRLARRSNRTVAPGRAGPGLPRRLAAARNDDSCYYAGAAAGGSSAAAGLRRSPCS